MPPSRLRRQKIDARYETPAQHHNPMELFQVICAWDGDELTVWESTQHVIGTQRGLAKQLGISPKRVRVIAPFVGGGFGCPQHAARRRRWSPRRARSWAGRCGWW